MKAGSLRHRIVIEEVTITQDSYGGMTEAWSTVSGCSSVPAAVEPLRGKEFFDSRQTVADVDIRVRIRYRSGIVPKMRVKFGSRYFDIKAVIHPEERKRTLELMCLETI